MGNDRGNSRCEGDSPSGRRWVWAAAGLIVAAGAIAYSNSFAGPFIFDDKYTIVDNPHIGDFWPHAFWGPKGSPSAGRPVVSLSLWLNYVLGGSDVWGYHFLNLLIHLLAGLALFGVVRRTLLLRRQKRRFDAASTALALACALIWTLHPLQTESVTYISQRAEALMGLFFLLTFYCAIRSFGQSRRRWGWYAAAIVCCALAVLSKEAAAVAPLALLLYDRAFAAGRFRRVFRRRWWLYAGMAGTWVILGLLTAANPRGETVGFYFPKLPELNWFVYACTQANAIMNYLKLSFWPSPLILDYGWALARKLQDYAPSAGVVLSLVAGTGVLLWCRPRWGFLGAWFFLILGPSSSFLPIASEIIAEHRMYLPLAAIVAAAVVAGYLLGGRLLRTFRASTSLQAGIAGAAVTGAALVLGHLTYVRNIDYRTEIDIWADTVRKQPGNQRAHYNLGTALTTQGRYAESIPSFTKAVTINPGYWEAHNNLGLALTRLGRNRQAAFHMDKVLRLKPKKADAWLTMGTILARLGKPDQAIASYLEALYLKPDYLEAHFSLGSVLAGQGRVEPARQHLARGAGISPESAEAFFRLGLILLEHRKFSLAAEEFAEALRRRPGVAEAHFRLGLAYDRMGRYVDAVEQYNRALKLKPDHPGAHNSLGIILARAKRYPQAIRHFQAVLAINPAAADAHNNLGFCLANTGRTDEAIRYFRQALEIKPDHAGAHNNLGLALMKKGRVDEAIEHYRTALRINPNDRGASENLRAALAGKRAGS